MAKPNKTQQLIDTATSLAAAELAKKMAELTARSASELDVLLRLAKELGVEDPSFKLSEDDERRVQSIAWTPVARQAVVTAVRAMCEPTAGAEQRICVSLNELSNDDARVQTLARKLNLATRDALMVLRITTDVLWREDLFKEPRTIRVDGRMLSIQRTAGGFEVRVLERIMRDSNPAPRSRQDQA